MKILQLKHAEFEPMTSRAAKSQNALPPSRHTPVNMLSVLWMWRMKEKEKNCQNWSEKEKKDEKKFCIEEEE